MNYAVIEDNDVINTIVWDGVADWSPPEGAVAVLIDEGVQCGTGFSAARQSDGTWAFAPPPPPPAAPRTDEQIVADNTGTRNQLLNAASLAMAPLQDAVDLGIAWAQKESLLLGWKQFRVSVNRTDLHQSAPQWPSPPAPLNYLEAGGSNS
jgi:hypothetical protein